MHVATGVDEHEPALCRQSFHALRERKEEHRCREGGRGHRKRGNKWIQIRSGIGAGSGEGERGVGSKMGQHYPRRVL